ncbi:glutamate-1-semialdehyde 2,1-aminomutase [soil metagenome]
MAVEAWSNLNAATRARHVTPAGVNSSARASTASTVMVRGDGAHLWDADGNRFIDYLLGRGPAILGHNCKPVNDAVSQAVAQGITLGTSTPLEIEAAEAVRGVLGWPEQIRFAGSGSEANQIALRVARAATGRNLVVQFESHYHGWIDSVFARSAEVGSRSAAGRSPGQAPGALSDVLIVPWNDIDVLTEIFDDYTDQIAAVIMEPIMMNHDGAYPSDGYLAEVQRLTRRHGTVLILDEVITGFRVAPGGAAQLFGIQPDLATYAKAMAAGWPVAAVAGRRQLLEVLDVGGANHGGTYNGNSAAMAATLATMDLIKDGAVHRKIHAVGAELMAGLSRVATERSVPLRVHGSPAAFFVDLVDREDLPPREGSGYNSIVEHFAVNGIWIGKRGSWYVSSAHDGDDIAHTLDSAISVFDTMRLGEF